MNEKKGLSTADIQEPKEGVKAVSEIQVSEGTAKYIRLKTQLHELWNNLYKAIDEDGIEIDTETDNKLYENLAAIDKDIEDFLLLSIRETLGNSAKKNII